MNLLSELVRPEFIKDTEAILGHGIRIIHNVAVHQTDVHQYFICLQSQTHFAIHEGELQGRHPAMAGDLFCIRSAESVKDLAAMLRKTADEIEVAVQ